MEMKKRKLQEWEIEMRNGRGMEGKNKRESLQFYVFVSYRKWC